MTLLKIPYGEGFLEGESQLNLRLMEPDWALALAPDGVNKAFPAARLSAFLSGKHRVALVVPDQTRPCGAPELLGLLAPLLEGKDATLVTANGLHPKMDRRVMEGLYGAEALTRWPLVQHDPDAADLVSLGQSPFGHEVLLNPAVAGAEAVITLSVVSLHYFAGFGGARKMLLPGVAGRASITLNHLMLIERPNPGPGYLEGNPLHEEMRWVEKFFAGRLFHLVVGLAEDGRIAALWGFEGGDGFEEACVWVREHHVAKLEKRFPFAVVSCGGHPKDINAIQTNKSFEFAHRAVERGGVILFLSACPQGVGSPHFLPWFRYAGNEAAWREALLDGYQVNGQTALAWHRKSRSHELWMITQLSDEAFGPLGGRRFASLQPALDELFARYGEAEGLLIPHAASVMPVVA